MTSDRSTGSSNPSQNGGSSAPVSGARYGRLVKLKPEYRERYIVLHEHPFPEVIERIRASNVCNYSIFLQDDLLFSFFEYLGNDYEADMEAMAENETVQDWWTLTDPMQESLTPDDSDAWWVTMDEFYHAGPKTRPSAETVKKGYLHQLRDGSMDVVHRAYAEVDGLDEAIERTSVQNYTVYGWREKLFTYLECPEDDPGEALEQLRETPPMRKLRERLTPHPEGGAGAQDPPRTMNSVFYMP